MINYDITIEYQDVLKLKNTIFKSEIPPIKFSAWRIKHWFMDRKITMLKYAIKRSLPHITVTRNIFGINLYKTSWGGPNNIPWWLKQQININADSPLRQSLKNWDGTTVPINITIPINEEFLNGY